MPPDAMQAEFLRRSKSSCTSTACCSLRARRRLKAYQHRGIQMWSKRVLQGQRLLAQRRRRCESAWLIDSEIRYLGDSRNELLDLLLCDLSTSCAAMQCLCTVQGVNRTSVRPTAYVNAERWLRAAIDEQLAGKRKIARCRVPEVPVIMCVLAGLPNCRQGARCSVRPLGACQKGARRCLAERDSEQSLQCSVNKLLATASAAPAGMRLPGAPGLR